MTAVITTAYIIAISAVAAYGVLGLLTLFLYWRHHREAFPCPAQPDTYPMVTVQLPIYNEKYVIERLVEAAVSLDYPQEKLQIQIVDDSTDDTADMLDRLVCCYRKQGVPIELVRRSERTGYKAGALANAMKTAVGDYIALFDADFKPQPHFLKQTIPHFLQDPMLGMVQTRWGHLNQPQSALTAVQAIALDKHFAIEQTVRHRADLFPKFNGAGGVWRRSCLEDAGGWEDDTVTEDLCLSTRAILNGWQFRFLVDEVSPAELPASISAYKSQQARWAKGSSQCLLKYGRSILTATNQSLIARLYALLTMSGYLTHFMVIFLLFLQIPLLLVDYRFSPRMLVFSITGIGQPILFVLAQHVLYKDWARRLRHLPSTLIIAIGMGPAICRAVLQIFTQRQHAFVRTPKYGDAFLQTFKRSSYRFGSHKIVLAEIGLALYALVGIGLAIYKQNVGPIFFLSTCVMGFGYIAYLTLREPFR